MPLNDDVYVDNAEMEIKTELQSESSSGLVDAGRVADYMRHLGAMTVPQPEDWGRDPVRADNVYSGTVTNRETQWDAPGRLYRNPIPTPVYGRTVKTSDDIFEQFEQSKKKQTLPEIKTSRTICSVFHSMRDCLESLNFALLKSLIEEAQNYANRMEDGLHATRETAAKIYRVNENEDLTPENKQTMIRNLLTKRYDFDGWEIGG